MRHRIIWMVFIVWTYLLPATVCAQTESPSQVLAQWFEALMVSYESPDGALMEAMIGFYSGELQEKFMPEVGERALSSDRQAAEKSMGAAAKFHRKWATFLTTNNFTKANFQYAEEHVEGDLARLVVRSDSNVARSFHMTNAGARGWVISELRSPTEFAAMLRVLLIVTVCCFLLAVLAKKLIFS